MLPLSFKQSLCLNASHLHTKATMTNEDDNTKNKTPIRLSNNFYNYRSNKHKFSQEKPQQNDDDSDKSTRSSLSDHFVSPFTNELKKDPSSNLHVPHISSVFTDVERSQALDSFSKIFIERIGDAISSGKLSKAWKRGQTWGSWMTTDYSKFGSNDEQAVDAKDYMAERNMIQPHLTPFVWGITCSAITLLSLRVGKWYQNRKLGNLLTKANNAVKESVTKPKSASRMEDLRHRTSKDYVTYSQMNPFQKPTQGHLSQTVDSLMSLPVDMALSMLIGISTSIYLTQPQILMRDFSHAPLLQGKSVLSEELCVPFTEEMERINSGFHTYSIGNNLNEATQNNVISYREIWNDENLGEFDSLRAVRDFVLSCHERERKKSIAENKNI